MTRTDSSADPAAIDQRRREIRRSYFRWLPKGLLVAFVLVGLVHIATYGMHDHRPREALTQAATMSAVMFDWSRVREVGWLAFAIPAAFMLAVAFAVVYILPQ